MPIKLAVTPGEPAGIGPDLIIQLAQQAWQAQLVVFADRDMLQQRAKALGLALELLDYQDGETRIQHPGQLFIHHVASAATVEPGTLNPENGSYVVETLRLASDANINGIFDAVVTGPVHKGIINQGGISFSGHTEYFAQQSNTTDVVMLLATEGLRVALVTTHIPLAYVSKAITSERLEKVVSILHSELQRKFGIANPSIYVCGLNPHAGEAGHLGTEEQETITPTLDRLREQGMNLIGPLPADTIFQKKYLDNADAVLTMYHDQGLPVLKYKGFGASVNVTLGLPFIRTSVDHGTALDLAATGDIDNGSFKIAIEQAIYLAKNRIKP